MIQEQFLNKLLSSKNKSLITLNNLDSSYFSDHVREFNYINEHVKQYGNIPDLETFLAQFPEFDVIEVKESDKYLLDALIADKQKRYLANNYSLIRDKILKNDVEGAIALCLKASESVVKGVAFNSVDILRDTSRYDSYVDRIQDFKKYYITTGFKELDKIIGGWDREEELATIVARTNQGKSWILLECAVAAAKQGLNVGVYSGEMSERKVGYRVDTIIGHIANGSLIHGNENVQQQYKEFIDSLKDIPGSIRVLTPQMINGSAGVRALRAFIEKDNLDILFIDQHSLLEDDHHAKTPVERASNISKDLKNLQVMCRKPIISVSQQNRTKNENGKVDTTQIAQADRIGQDSTIVIFLEKKDDIMTMSLVKSRDSSNGQELHYLVNWNMGEVRYIPGENDAVGGESEIDYEHRYEEPAKGEEVFK